MKFAGYEGSQLMQRWIQDEFAYISFRRTYEISSTEEERRVRRELQLPEFVGENCEEWIFALEDIFHFFRLNGEAQMMAAMLSLAGGAQWWFEWEQRRRPIFGWNDLKDLMLRRFGSSTMSSWRANVVETEDTRAVGGEDDSGLVTEQGGCQGDGVNMGADSGAADDGGLGSDDLFGERREGSAKRDGSESGGGLDANAGGVEEVKDGETSHGGHDGKAEGGGVAQVSAGGGGGHNSEGRVVGCGSGGGPGSVAGVEMEVGRLKGDLAGRNCRERDYASWSNEAWFGLDRKKNPENGVKGSIVIQPISDNI